MAKYPSGTQALLKWNEKKEVYYIYLYNCGSWHKVDYVISEQEGRSFLRREYDIPSSAIYTQN